MKCVTFSVLALQLLFLWHGFEGVLHAWHSPERREPLLGDLVPPHAGLHLRPLVVVITVVMVVDDRD